MKPALRYTLIAVLAAGIAFGLTHLLIRFASRNIDEITWLRNEFQLTPEQTASIQKLHDDYRPICMQHCEAIMQARRQLAAATDKTAAQTELDRLETVCRDATLAHLRRVAAIMAPEQGSRFLQLVEPKIAGQTHTSPLGLK